jgi:invasion protein IalB
VVQASATKGASTLTNVSVVGIPASIIVQLDPAVSLVEVGRPLTVSLNAVDAVGLPDHLFASRPLTILAFTASGRSLTVARHSPISARNATVTVTVESSWSEAPSLLRFRVGVTLPNGTTVILEAASAQHVTFAPATCTSITVSSALVVEAFIGNPITIDAIVTDGGGQTCVGREIAVELFTNCSFAGLLLSADGSTRLVSGATNTLGTGRVVFLPATMPVVHVTTWTIENYTATNCSSTNASDCVLSRNVTKVETRGATLCSLALVASSLPSRLELGTVTFAVAVPMGLSVTPSVANVSLGETMEFAVAVVNGYGAVAASVSGSATLTLSGCADAAWIANASTLQLLAGRSRFAWRPTREVSNCTLQIRLVPTVSQGQAYDSNATVRVAKPTQLSVSLAPVMKTGTAVSVFVEMQDATGALVPARSPASVRFEWRNVTNCSAFQAGAAAVTRPFIEGSLHSTLSLTAVPRSPCTATGNWYDAQNRSTAATLVVTAIGISLPPSFVNVIVEVGVDRIAVLTPLPTNSWRIGVPIQWVFVPSDSYNNTAPLPVPPTYKCLFSPIRLADS